MKRGQKTSAEQVVLKLRQIEVQTAQGKNLALACKDAEISEQSYQGRVPTPRDFLLSQGGADRDRHVAEHLQPCSAALFLGLPTARARYVPGSGLAPTHGRYHAVAFQLARSKIPVRSTVKHLLDLLHSLRPCLRLGCIATRRELTRERRAASILGGCRQLPPPSSEHHLGPFGRGASRRRDPASQDQGPASRPQPQTGVSRHGIPTELPLTSESLLTPRTAAYRCSPETR